MSHSQFYDGPLVLTRLMEDRAERLGDRIALSGRWGSLTYEALWRDSLQLATLMADLGVKRGDRVANAIEAGPEALKLIIATAALGAIEVPIQPAMRGLPLENILRDTDPHLYVMSGESCEAAVRACEATGSRPRILWHGEDSPATRVDGRLSDASVASMSAVAHSREREPLWILFTSGTTGPSKGVLHTNRSGLRNALSAAMAAELTTDDVAYSFFTFAHITARSFVVLATALTGGSVRLRERLSVSEFWEDVTEGDVTWFPAMGSVLRMLELSMPERTETSLRLICAGGITTEQKVRFEQQFGVELLDIYGLTETGTISAQRPGRSHRLSVGTVLPHFEVQIQNADGYPVPASEVGEICVRPNEPNAMFAGYWQRADSTLDAWRDLWFHTGDSGKIDEYGELVFVDRYKDMIRRRGENISSYEVEAAVLLTPGVRECAAFPLPINDVDEEVMIAVVTDSAVPPKTIVAICETALPKYAVPRFIRFVEELPKTPSQRIQKQRLRSEGAVPGTWDRQAGAEG